MRAELGEMIALVGQPITVVEDPRFINLVKSLVDKSAAVLHVITLYRRITTLIVIFVPSSIIYF